MIAGDDGGLPARGLYPDAIPPCTQHSPAASPVPTVPEPRSPLVPRGPRPYLCPVNFIQRYLRYLRPHSLRIFGMFIAGLAFVAFSGVSLWMAADFVQALFSGGVNVPPMPDGPITPMNFSVALKHWSAALVVSDSPVDTLRRAIVFIVGAFLLKNVSLYLQTLLAASVEQRITKRMRDDLYDKLMGQDLAFFHVRKAGDIVAAGVNDILQLNSGLAEAFAKLLRDPLNILLFLLLLLSISWKMTLGVLVIAPLAGLVTGIAGSSLKRKSKRTQARLGVVSSRLNETLYGMRIVQAYGGQAQEEREFGAATEEHYRQALRRERLRRLVPPLEEMVGVVVISVILLVAGGKVLGGQWLAPDDFVRFLVLLFGLLTPLVSLGEVQARMKVAEGAAERVFDLMDEHHEIDQPAAPVAVSSFEKELRLEGVELGYGDERGTALVNIGLTIRPKERVVLVGRSGSGKSSLLNLLPRFYDPTGGTILLDGHDLRELRIADLRSLFGIVSQEVTLFHDTVRNNIAYGHDEVPLERVVEAAKQARAHDFIEAMPGGYDTDLGNLGERLSGGQRQRISIARALLKDPPILLLDEPTSALDSDVAEEIQKTLDEVGEGRTVITATHRLASIRPGDRVVLMDEGRIVADGLHEELYRESDLYRELLDRQVEGS